MPRVRLFEYAVVLQPKTNKDGETTEDGLIVVQPECVLATDESQASLKAARAIPDEYMDRLDRLEVVVRPF